MNPFVKFATEYLPKDYDPGSEVFFGVLIFRQKWVTSVEDRTRIPSDLIMGSQVIPGDLTQVGCGLAQLALLKDLPKTLVTNKGIFTSEYLYKRFPEAVSLMIVWEPRSLNRGVEKFTLKVIKAIFQGGYINPLKEWKTCFHKANRRGDSKFALIDFDKGDLEDIKPLVRELDTQYIVSTPSGGVHVVVKIDDRARKKLFVDKDLPEGVEVKTSPFLTHVPGVNPHVRPLLDFEHPEI